MASVGQAQSTQALGRLGEQLAAEHLERRGFRILERNYRTRWGELDIVAFDGRTLVFCEVKSRRLPSAGAGLRPGPTGRQSVAAAPFDGVHARKRAQVRKMAARWFSERANRPYAPAVRFDAIGVTFDRRGELVRLDHLEGAF